MEILLLAALVLAALGSLALRHHLQVAAWDRELETAFGSAAHPEMPSHRRL